MLMFTASSVYAAQPIGLESGAKLAMEDPGFGLPYVDGIATYAVIVQDAGQPVMPDWRISFINCMTSKDPQVFYDATLKLMKDEPKYLPGPAVSVVLVAIDSICPRPPGRNSVVGPQK
jgi:hypothetical protein